MPETIPWWQPQVGPSEFTLVREVLESNYLNDGAVTRRFEEELAKRLGCKHVVGVTSGTSALFLALAGLGVGHGDEVVVPDLTFIATANAVTLTGAKVVLVDVDPSTLNMDPEAFRKAITSRTKAVIPVHVSGRPADLKSILTIAGKHGVAVVEDAAEGLMSRYEGKCLGTIGAAGIVSFSPNKTITTGQGGAVMTDDDALHVKLRELKDQGRALQGTGGDDHHPCVGYNFKLTNLQAAVGLGQLEYLDARLERMKRTFAGYHERLLRLPGIRLLGFNLRAGEAPQWVDALVDKRNQLHDSLLQAGMQCRRFWFPLHTQLPYRRSDRDFPASTQVTSKGLWLPSAFTMTDDHVDKVCRHIRTFLEES